MVKRGTGSAEWEEITRNRTEDLLVYMALGRFQRRPPMTALPIGLQRDIRAFFGSYTKACRQADDLLFRSEDRRKDMQRRDGPMILGHRPTVAAATIHVGRQLLQRHDGGGGKQTDRDVVRFR
jgi:hypothetical protein